MKKWDICGLVLMVKMFGRLCNLFVEVRIMGGV